MGSNRLRVTREEQGLTQAALAERSNVPQRHVSALELGKIADPRWSTVYRLARALRRRAELLFPVEG
jgi:transcriptional regulator with XRE-family HTH domain